MGRKRIHDIDSLPSGLYRAGVRYRARKSSCDPWRYFSGSRTEAIAAFTYWKYPDHQTNFQGQSRAALLLRGIRKNAISRKIQVDISLSDIEAMLNRACGRCEFFGMAFSDEEYAGYRIRPWAPTVDRIDSSRGYANGNCRVICAYVNMALNQFGDAFFHRVAAALMVKLATDRPSSPKIDQKHRPNPENAAFATPASA